MKYLRVEHGVEELTLRQALEAFPCTPGGPAEAAVVALLERLAVTPVSRHGGFVTVEDANYLPSGPARCEEHVRDISGASARGTRTCGLTLNGDGTCNGARLHVADRDASGARDAALETLRGQGKLDPNWHQA